MLVTPMEQTLEEFYNKIGSKYVSEVVKKDFEVQGRTNQNTSLTKSFANRLSERRPLLLSPTNSSRPLGPNAAKMLDNLEVVQAETIRAKYSFERSTKHLKVTCCCKQPSRQKTTIYVTADLDWFDVGSAIGGLILQRCQLEDALLLSQLLESPLETLRYRGFPVDRILRPVSKPQPPPPPPEKPSPPETERMAHEATNDKAVSDSRDNTVKGKPESTGSATHTENKGGQGFASILSQMFPACDMDTIQGLLGPNPTKEKAREVAELLSSQKQLDVDDAKVQGDIQQSNASTGSQTLPSNGTNNVDNVNDSRNHNVKEERPMKKKSSSLMGKMLKPFQHHGIGSGGGKRIVQQETQSFSHSGSASASPENDASTQKSLELMLNQAVQSTRSVDHAGVRSPETLLNHLPQGLERGSDGCEVISAQNIQPFAGPHGNCKTRNGIKVFSGAKEAPAFLAQNFHAAERFAVVIEHIAAVYKLNLATVAIYYEPSGNTIAFNSNKALYFNLRFFCALHQSNVDSTCYSYW